MRILILLLVAVTVPAQDTAKVKDPAAASTSHGDQQRSFPLRGIAVEGNDNFPADEIIALSGLEIGQQVRPLDFERALTKINAAGVFDSLEFRYGPAGDGYEVIFKVQEVSELYPVRFDGFGVPDEQIRELLREKVPLFGPKVPPTGPVIERIGDALQTFWKEQGNESEVMGALTPLGDEEYEMLYQPESAVETIAFTQFENTEVIPSLELQRVFQNVAAGVAYSEERLQELLRFNLGPLYEEKGRLEVTFCPCTTEPDVDTKGLVVTIQVDEGPEYAFGEIMTPEQGSIEPGAYAELLKFNTGELANMGLVAASRDAIEATLKAGGFMNADIEIEREVDKEIKTVDVTFKVDAGDRYTFNRLTIEGLNIIGEAAVRKRWGLQVGDPFNASYPAFFLSRIQEEGMFDNLKDTGWSIQVNEQEKTVDVSLVIR